MNGGVTDDVRLGLSDPKCMARRLGYLELFLELAADLVARQLSKTRKVQREQQVGEPFGVLRRCAANTYGVYVDLFPAE